MSEKVTFSKIYENMQSVLKKSAGEIIPASSKKRNLIYKRCIFAA